MNHKRPFCYLVARMVGEDGPCMIKELLRRNLEKFSLHLDELTTIVYECEAIINFRP